MINLNLRKYLGKRVVVVEKRTLADGTEMTGSYKITINKPEDLHRLEDSRIIDIKECKE